MTVSTPFIRRTVATTLMTLAIALAGWLAYGRLPVASLPKVEFPTIQISVGMPGAAPEVMASSVVTPLEHHLGWIAGVTEMTSTSSLGSAQITMQFDLDRDIDAAGRDVQAAIDASLGDLPANLPTRPSYRKINPADAPIVVLALTSPSYDRAAMYEAASTIISQRLSQVEGVGQVVVGGSSLPAVRVEVDPDRLAASGLAMADLHTAIAAANANRPKGELADAQHAYALTANDQLRGARAYEPLVVGRHGTSTIRLRDVAHVVDAVEDLRVDGRADGKPAVVVVVFRQPGANIITTVDRVRALLPHLQASIPAGIHIAVAVDRTTSIRASVRDVEVTLAGAVVLVVLVVFAFLREWRSALIACVAVPVSLIGTCAAMYVADYNIDNLSLMALTIATGFVVDDAIVVVESVQRHIEEGMPPRTAALAAAKEIGFTVISISISLIAVFVPILLMGGIVGRLFREFAVTLSIAVLVSLAISLTTTPMLCAVLLTGRRSEHGRIYTLAERLLVALSRGYTRSLAWVLRHARVMLVITVAILGLTVHMFQTIPKGFFPQQDTGRLLGAIIPDQAASSQALKARVAALADITAHDPAVHNVVAFTSGNSARLFAVLEDHRPSADAVIARLRRSLAGVAGATLYLQPTQDLLIGGRSSAAQFQYTLQSTDLTTLATWTPRVLAALRRVPGLVDVNSDLQDHGRQLFAAVDRDEAARLGIDASAIDEELYDRFGQRQVSTTYTDLNQYHVVLEVAPDRATDPSALAQVRVRSHGAPILLPSVAAITPSSTPLTIAHQSGMPAVTISFGLAGISLGTAVARIEETAHALGLPPEIHTHFAGTAQAFQDSLASEPWLLLAAVVAVYLVLGILYESLIHPLTILSTLPSAGLGALLALRFLHLQLDVIALIGIILLVGIVKKNAILMIDFAITARREGMSPHDAIARACQLRFRPIMMTTMAAMLGALPLALGLGAGGELRRPLGVAIVGGLLVSQILTIYTTPVIYLAFERLRTRFHRAVPLVALLAGCSVGPSYHRPSLPVPPTYAGVATAGTIDPVWWRLFQDDTLNALEVEALAGNPSLAAALARVAEARAVTTQAQAARSPTITANPSLTRSKSPLVGNAATTALLLPFDLSYEVDVWGGVRRNIQAAHAQALASADAYGVVRLTLTANVATTYYTLRSLDTQRDVLAHSLATSNDALALTRTKHDAGLAGETDVAQAQAQVEATAASLTDVERQRGDAQHALAILVGRPPSALALATHALAQVPPSVPAGVPSSLLRRRPDVLEAEHALIAATASIGVAKAQLYPTFSLTASGGVASAGLSSALGGLWSIGAGIVAPIFNGGKLRAQVVQARATYDEMLGNYRASVLQALADVETGLTDLAHLATSGAQYERAARAADENLTLVQLQYRQGLVDYLSVLDAQRTLLSDQLLAVQTRGQRFISTVLLVKALGGGWSEATGARVLARAPVHGAP